MLHRLLERADGNVTADQLMEDLLVSLALLPADKQDKKRQAFAAKLLQGLTAKLKLSEAWQSWLGHPL